MALIFVHGRYCGPGNSVSILTGYGLDGPGIESWWGEIFRTCPDQPWGPPSLLYNGYWVFPGGRKRLGHDTDPSPHSSAEVKKQSRAIPLLSLRAFVAYKKSETYLHGRYVSQHLVLTLRMHGTQSTLLSIFLWCAQG
jgi:hypothetical protein